MVLTMRSIKFIYLFLLLGCHSGTQKRSYIEVIPINKDNSAVYKQEFERGKKHFSSKIKDFDWNNDGVYIIQAKDKKWGGPTDLYYFNPLDDQYRITLIVNPKYSPLVEEKCTFNLQLDSADFNTLVTFKISELPYSKPYINGLYPYYETHSIKYVGLHRNSGTEKYFYFETIKQFAISTKADGSLYYLHPYLEIPHVLSVYDDVFRFLYTGKLDRFKLQGYSQCDY
mgnify:CR=1 FL=1